MTAAIGRAWFPIVQRVSRCGVVSILRRVFRRKGVSVVRRVFRRRSVSVVAPATVAGRSLALIFAIMTWLACLAIGAASMMARTAEGWLTAVASEITIQVQPLNGVDVNVQARKAAEAARATPGVARASVMEEAAAAVLLEPWLGTGLDLSALPVPRLVTLEIEPGASPNLAALKRRLSAIRGASLDDRRVWRNRLAAMAGTMIGLGLFVLVLVLVATTLTVLFATRGAMAGNRETVEVLDLIGAERSFIAREFQRRFFAIGLKGAAAGGLAAGVTFLGAWIALALIRPHPAADQIDALFGAFSLGPVGWCGVLVAAPAVAALAAGASRAAVLQVLKETA